MNVREGGRRLALLVGVFGLCLGCVISWTLGSEGWRTYRDGREYSRLLSTPMVQQVMAAEKSVGVWSRHERHNH
jgi:hypothetical protein